MSRDAPTDKRQRSDSYSHLPNERDAAGCASGLNDNGGCSAQEFMVRAEVDDKPVIDIEYYHSRSDFSCCSTF